MKRKLLSVLLALTLLGQSVYAISLKDYMTTVIDNPAWLDGNGRLDYSLVISDDIHTTATATAKEAGAGTYSAYPTSSAPLNSTTGFDYKVSLDMSNVSAEFDALHDLTIASIEARNDGQAETDLKNQFANSSVTGTFTVTVTYNANLERGTSEFVFGQEGLTNPEIFELDGTVDYSTNPINVNFKVKDGVTVDAIKNSTTAFNDLYVTLDGVTTNTTNTALDVTAELTHAEVILKEGAEEFAVLSFDSNASTVYVYKPYSTGGSNSGGFVSFQPKAYAVVGEAQTPLTLTKNGTKYFLEVDKVSAPTKEGATFEGWYLDEAFTQIAEGSIEVKETLYIYAKFSDSEVPSASIVLDGEEVPVEPTVIDGKSYLDVSALPVPEKEGFAFDGWFLEPYFITKAEGMVEITGKTCLYPRFVNLNAPADLISEDHFAYIVGYPDGEVKPNGLITREEVAAAFYRLLDPAKKAEIETTEHSFPDVNSGRWSEEEIATLANGGYIVGDENGYFNPAKPITRAEFVTIASKFAENMPAPKVSYFTDIDGHWAEEYINKVAYSSFWIFGYDDGTFKPNASITRAEAMAIINRMLVRYGDVTSEYAKDWPDLFETDWYYGPVIEATTDNFYERHENGWSEAWITEAEAEANQPSETPAE